MTRSDAVIVTCKMIDLVTRTQPRAARDELVKSLFRVPLDMFGGDKLVDLEDSQIPRWLALVEYQIAANRAKFHTDADYYAMRGILADAKGLTPARAYRVHPAFTLATQFAALRTDEGRIMAKHYFRVALRGIIAGVQ